MSTWAKRLLFVVVALVAATVFALVAVTRFVHPDRLAGFVAAQVRAATGRDFSVTGGLRVRLFPRVAVVAGEVRLGNASWGSRPDMLRVRRLEGSMPLLPLLRGRIQLDQVVFHEPELFLETDPAGTANWDFGGPGTPAAGGATESGGGAPLSLVLRTIAAENGTVIHRNGTTGEETRLALDRLTLKRSASIAGTTLDLVGSHEKRPFTVTGTLVPLETFLFRRKPMAVDLGLATEGGTATLTGKIDRGGSGPLFEGMVQARVAGSLAGEKSAQGQAAAAFPLDLSAKLTVERDTYHFDEFKVAYGPGAASGSLALRLDSPQPDLAAAFTATWRAADAGKELRLSVDRLTLKRNPSTRTNALECAGALQGQPFTLAGLLGPLQPFLAGDNPLAIDLALAMEGARATFLGKMERDDGGLRPDVAVRVHVEGTSGLARLAGGPVDLPVPLDLAGGLTRREKTWRVDGLEIATARGRASGNLALHLGTGERELTGALAAAWRGDPAGEEVRLTLERVALRRGGGATEDVVDLAGSLRGQPFTLAGRVGDLEKFFVDGTSLPLDLAFATERVTATLAGKVDRGAKGMTPDLRVKARVEGTPALARLAGRSVPLPVPLDLAGRLTVRDKTWRVEGLEASSGRSRATGNLTVRLGGPRPEVDAVIDAPLIDLPELAGWRDDEGKAAETRSRRLFSESPLPFDALRGFDGRLQLTAARLVLAGWLGLEAVTGDLALREGRLTIDPLRFLIAGGAVAGAARVEAAADRTPLVSLTLEGGGISLERYVADLGYPKSVAGGTVELNIRLSGSGASVRAIMSGLEGEFRLSSGQARLTTLALAPGDILTGVFETINPFRSRDNFTDLTCAVVRLPVRGGLVTIDRTVAYETNKVATAVAGTISLETEALDLAIKPTIRSAFGLAGAPSKAEFVRIAGTLTAPKVELNALTSARTAISAGGAIATAGLSLIGEALFKKTTADYQPCRTALEKVIPEGRAKTRPAGPPEP